MYYNYLEEMKDDIREYIEDNEIDLTDYEDEQEAYGVLYDTLFVEDSITGNGSGSYTFSGWQAKQFVIENTDICAEALQEFCVDTERIADKFLNDDWEYFDVTIRCYLLGQALGEVLKELMTTYTSYEEGSCGTYTLDGMRKLYAKAVDKTEYADFDDWFYDVLKSGVFEKNR